LDLPQRGGPLVGPGELREIDAEGGAAAPIDDRGARLLTGLSEPQLLFVERPRRLQVLDRQHGLYGCIAQHSGLLSHHAGRDLQNRRRRGPRPHFPRGTSMKLPASQRISSGSLASAIVSSLARLPLPQVTCAPRV